MRNIALAIAAAEELGQFGFKVTPKQIEQGIRRTHWPGRFQVLAPPPATDGREMVLDVAHNPAGAWALRSALSESFPERELTLVFAAMRDKAIQEIADVLFPIAAQVIVTTVNNPRAETTSELLQAGSRSGARLYAEETATAALARAGEVCGAEGVIVVTGSIYLVGEVMKIVGVRA